MGTMPLVIYLPKYLKDVLRSSVSVSTNRFTISSYRYAKAFENTLDVSGFARYNISRFAGLASALALAAGYAVAGIFTRR